MCLAGPTTFIKIAQQFHYDASDCPEDCRIFLFSKLDITQRRPPLTHPSLQRPLWSPSSLPPSSAVVGNALQRGQCWGGDRPGCFAEREM